MPLELKGRETNLVRRIGNGSVEPYSLPQNLLKKLIQECSSAVSGWF